MDDPLSHVDSLYAVLGRSHEKRSGEWKCKDSISRLVNYPLPSASCPPQHISPHSWSCSQCHLYSDLLMTGSQLCKNRKVFRPNKQHWGKKMSFRKGDSLCCSRPVPLSFAETCTIPLASMSNVTSIWGTPRGAGGIPIRVNWPSTLLSAAISLSPWQTLISTWVCPSAAVENTCSTPKTPFTDLPLTGSAQTRRLINLPGSSLWELWYFCWWVWWRHRPGSQYPKRAGLHPTAAHQWHHRPKHLPGWLLRWPPPRRD